MNFEREPDAKLFRLQTTARLAEVFGHPELTYDTYHVTGSKGKGSVSRMLACVLSEIEKTRPVGVYASPHVYDFRERVGAANGFLPDTIYNNTVREFTTAIDKLHDSETCGSWFELNAAFAFLAFKNAGCKHAVFEVGMGGRLDATNIIKPRICCITEIELEHTKYLGDTLEKIAYEKAGIIKENTPVVVAAQKSEKVKDIFRQVAAAKNAPIYFVDEIAKIKSIKYQNERLLVEISGDLFARNLKLELKMLAKVQALNAMQVAVAMKILYPELDEAIIERGLSRASLPGRFEIRNNLVLDGAHTVESIKETLATFDELHHYEPRNLLFAIAEGKDVSNIAKLFDKKFDQIFVTRPGDFKKSDLRAVVEAFKKAGIKIIYDEDYQKIIQMALDSSQNKKLLITGSFYLLDEVHKNLKKA